ncbi:MAG: 30S ribosomal protein S8 [Balneolaceae bacterium]|nr:30S ribosomal protein S8 [Balneolaceae bacterium]
MTDPISDFLTRIRNAQGAGHRRVDIPASKMKRAMTQILLDKGYIQNFLDIDDGKQGLIRIFLKYDHYGTPVIKKLDRVSKPGLRKYCSSEEVPRVLNGYGIAILTTSKGVMTDKEARKLKVGGEIICYVY